MKRYFSFLCIFALLVSCYHTDEQLTNNLAPSTGRIFTASFEQNDTRTYVEEGNLLRWNEGDQITIFDSNTLNQQYKFDGQTGDNGGTFSKVSSSFGTGNDLSCHYAVYPYNQDIKITETGIITATLPAEQSYAENSFGLGANTMVAVTESVDDTFLKFRNVGGYLKLQLYGDDVTIRSITLTGNNSEKIAGKATITATYGQDPIIAMSDDATTGITLDCGDGVKIGATEETATSFWIVVPPTIFEKGFEVTITDVNGDTFTKSTSKEVVIERNLIRPMSAFEVEIEKIPNSQILYTYSGENGINPYNNRAFLDVEGNILEYTNEYADGKGVITFNGILATLGNMAFWSSGDNQLTSITLPNGLTKIETEAFIYCSQLETVTLPNTLIDVEVGAFHQHPNLSKFYGKFATEDGRCLIVNGVLNAFAPNGYDASEYTIPDGVTAIGDWAFYYCSSLTSVTIPDSVTTIGDSAFDYCSSLTSVTIPDSVTTIGDSAFYYCSSLTSVTIPDSVTTIGDYAFSMCTSLTSVTIPDGVTAIGDCAFYYCSGLTSVTIPDSVTTIGERAFFRCDSLKEFKGKYTTENGYSLVVGDTLIAFAPACDATEYIVPNSVARIASNAFYGCKKLTSVTISGSVSSIGDYAFYYCDNITEIYCEATIPPIAGDSYSYIFDHSWRGKIYVYQECVDIYKSAWSNYYELIYENGNYPYNASTIIYYTTSDEQIITCDKLPIKSNTYSNGQGKMVIYGGVKLIPEDAFHNERKLTSITIPSSVTTIGDYAFASCDSLTSVTIGDSVTTIGDSAFYMCTSLTSVTIPDSVTTIGDYAFASCDSLTSVTIGDSVTTIGNGVFLACTNIAEFKGKFASKDGRSLIINDTITHYANASGTKYTIPDGVATIGLYAFALCSNLTTVTIPESVTDVYPGAFIYCFNLKEFKGKFAADGGRCLIMDDAIVVYANASGTSYTIPNNVTTIRPVTFMGCGLTSVTLPDSVTTIGDLAFANCSSLTSVTIPDSVTVIGSSAFSDCSLKVVDVKAVTPPSISYDTFGNSNNIEFYIPAKSLDAYLAADYWKDLNLIVM